MTTSGSAGKQSPSFTQNQQDKYIGHQESKRSARSTPDPYLSAAQPVLPAMDRSASGHGRLWALSSTQRSYTWQSLLAPPHVFLSVIKTFQART